eukprot:COSAG03_NODE_1781_length_3530_cov_3.297872_2_plen_536_part_00
MSGWCKKGARAELNGKAGVVTMDPDGDVEVKLKYSDGSLSPYVKAVRLKRGSDAAGGPAEGVPPTKDAPPPLVWEVEGDSGWLEVREPQAKKITTAYISQQDRVTLDEGRVVDLKEFTQTRTSTGRARRIRGRTKDGLPIVPHRPDPRLRDAAAVEPEPEADAAHVVLSGGFGGHDMRGDCFVTYGAQEVRIGYQLLPLPGYNPVSIHADADRVPVWQSRTKFTTVENQPWHNYTPEASQQLEAAFQAGKKAVTLTFGDAQFKIDTSAMRQERVGRSNVLRDVQRVDATPMQWFGVQCTCAPAARAATGFCKCMGKCVPFGKEDNDKIEAGGDRVTMAGSQLTKTKSSSGSGREILIDKNAMRQYDTDASSADDTFRPVLAIPISLARILISGGPNFSGVVCVSLPASPSLSPSLRLPLCLPRWLPCFRRRFHSLCTVCKHRCQPPALSFACSTTVLSARRAARTKTSLTLTSRSWASATPSPRTTSCSSSGSSNTRTTSSLCAFAAWCYRSQSIDGNILTAGSDRADSHRLCDD